MYAKFYGLDKLPFQLTPDPFFFYESAEHRKAMAHLTYGLHNGEGFIVITGEIGAGKTTLDRKSTRLNSSHRCISYAVFCLKKKPHTTLPPCYRSCSTPTTLFMRTPSRWPPPPFATASHRRRRPTGHHTWSTSSRC